MPQENSIVHKLQDLTGFALIAGVFYAPPIIIAAKSTAELAYLSPVEQTERVTNPEGTNVNWIESFAGLRSVSGRVIEVGNENGRNYIALAPDNDLDGRIDITGRIIHATPVNLTSPLQVGEGVHLKISPSLGENRIISLYAPAT